MSRWITCLFFFVVFFVSGTVLANGIQFPRTGYELLKDCESALSCQDSSVQCLSDNLVSTGYCFGFIRGIIDLNALYVYVVGEKSGLFCAPTQGMGRAINAEHGARIVVRFLKEHPERLREGGATLSAAAFAKEYPCE